MVSCSDADSRCISERNYITIAGKLSGIVDPFEVTGIEINSAASTISIPFTEVVS